MKYGLGSPIKARNVLRPDVVYGRPAWGWRVARQNAERFGGKPISAKESQPEAVGYVLAIGLRVLSEGQQALERVDAMERRCVAGERER